MKLARLRASRARLFAFAGVAMLLALAGCSSTAKKSGPLAPIPNVRGPEAWSETWARVAVLPPRDATGRLTPDFTASLGESWLRSLLSTQRAEFVRVDTDTLARRHGFDAPDPTGRLPFGLLPGVVADTGADAVMLLELTQVSPYPPLALGCRARLVRPEDGETLWMADVLFDARDPGTVAYMRAQAGRPTSGTGDTQASIMLSPTRFADMVFRAVAETLPPRRAPEPDGKKGKEAVKSSGAEKIAEEQRISPQKFPVRAESTR